MTLILSFEIFFFFLVASVSSSPSGYSENKINVFKNNLNSFTNNNGINVPCTSSSNVSEIKNEEKITELIQNDAKVIEIHQKIETNVVIDEEFLKRISDLCEKIPKPIIYSVECSNGSCVLLWKCRPIEKLLRINFSVDEIELYELTKTFIVKSLDNDHLGESILITSF